MFGGKLCPFFRDLSCARKLDNTESREKHSLIPLLIPGRYVFHTRENGDQRHHTQVNDSRVTLHGEGFPRTQIRDLPSSPRVHA